MDAEDYATHELGNVPEVVEHVKEVRKEGMGVIPGRLREVTQGCLLERIHRPCTDVQESAVPVLSSLVLS